MLQLLAPTVHLHVQWMEARQEWGPGMHEDGFGLQATDDVDSSGGFEDWVARAVARADPVKAAAAGKVPCTFRWIVEAGQVLGGIALRHRLDGHLESLGHIGYGVRPVARGRGLATWAIGQMLNEARTLGLDRVLIVCETNNVGSIKAIERVGGVLECVEETEKYGALRRHWIST